MVLNPGVMGAGVLTAAQGGVGCAAPGGCVGLGAPPAELSSFKHVFSQKKRFLKRHLSNVVVLLMQP